jgi:hypothetical protein
MTDATQPPPRRQTPTARRMHQRAPAREHEIKVRLSGAEYARLKGGLYSRDDFDPARKAERPKRYAQPDPEREAQFSEKLERLKGMRREYHRQRYGIRDLPEPRPIDRQSPAPQIEPLDDYAARVLGDGAIAASDEAIEDAPSTQRARRAMAAREEEEALEQDEHHRRHL